MRYGQGAFQFISIARTKAAVYDVGGMGMFRWADPNRLRHVTQSLGLLPLLLRNPYAIRGP